MRLQPSSHFEHAASAATNLGPSKTGNGLLAINHVSPLPATRAWKSLSPPPQPFVAALSTIVQPV